MLTWKRSITATAWRLGEGEDTSDLRVEAFKERMFRCFESLVKGTLAAVLYGSGTLVLSGVLFYFSWKLGIAALFVLGGLLPLAGSAYLLWRGRWRQVAIIKLAWRLGGRLTVADVALGTGLTLGEAKATLNELARKGYAGLEVSPSGVLVYHFFPLVKAPGRSHVERVLS
jgi:hypothetical protein